MMVSGKASTRIFDVAECNKFAAKDSDKLNFSRTRKKPVGGALRHAAPRSLMYLDFGALIKPPWPHYTKKSLHRDETGRMINQYPK